VSSTDSIPGNGAGGTASIGRVIVVEDQRLVAEFFTYHCRDLGLDVIQRCGTCREGLIAIRALRPDLVLMDISLPDGDGLELAKTILDELPEVKILAISSHRDPWTMLQVQRIGLHGFVDKNDQRPEVLTEAIHAVLAGRVYYTPIVNESSASIRRDPKAFIRVLSDYETRILSMIGESKTDEEIATVLNISPATVQSRRRDIMSKLDVHTTPKLIHYAIVNGLTRVEQLGQKKPI
jgi:DNA-binding NarL/FixJ family response regulator